MAPRQRTINGGVQLSLEESVRLLAMDLARARSYDKGVLEFAVFRAEATRARAERLLEDRLSQDGLRVHRVRVRPDDDTRDLPLYLHWNPPPRDAVVLVYDLRRGFPATLQYLNYRREFLVEDRIKAVFWVLEDEARRLALEAPDFWAFRGQVVEFLEVPPPAEMAALVRKLAWWGYKERLPEEERQARIALRERLLADLPDDDSSLAARAELLLALGWFHYWGGVAEYAMAEAAWDEALALAERTNDTRQQARAHNGLGNTYAARGHLDKAIAAFQRAIALEPTNARPYNNLGSVYHEQGCLNEAIAEFQRAIELDPAFARSYNNLGDVYYDQGRLDEAFAAYQQAIALEQTNAMFHHSLGSVYANQGRLDEAIVEFQQASILDPTAASPHIGLGSVYRVQGRLDEAAAKYQLAVQLSPASAGSYFNWALLEAARGNIDAALVHLQDAIERAPLEARREARTASEFAPLREDPRFQAVVGKDEG